MTFKLNNLHPKEDLSACNPRVCIIGGGVAGMACALWLKQLGFSAEIIERNATLGGQLNNIDRINRWVLGFQGLTSQEIARVYSNHTNIENISVRFNTEPAAVETMESGYRLYLQNADGNQTVSEIQSLVIATGVRALGSEVFNKTPGFGPLFAAGLIGCFPTDHLSRMEFLRGKTLAVIGGGDNAHFTVNDVALVAARTYLLMRSQPKAQKKIRNEVRILIDQERVMEYPEVEIIDFRQTWEGIELSLSKSGSVTAKIKVDMVFVRIGFTPNSEFLQNLDNLASMKKHSNGYIEIDSWRRTSIASVYAIGDVANPRLQSVVTAIADGAIAARAIAQSIDK